MKLTTEQLVQELSDFVNSYNKDREKELLALMSNEHRTLQQSFTKLCFRWIEHVAKDEYRTDGRNEDSKKTAQLILRLMSEHFAKEGYTGLSNGIMTLPSNHLPLV
jgi:hypothetical protein